MSETVAAPPAVRPVTPIPDRKSSRSAIGFIILGVSLCTLVGLFYSVIASGMVQGVEFCPGDYSVRTFVYYEIPLIHVQIYPITHTNQAGTLETFLHDHKLIPATDPQASQTWHLVSVTHGGSSMQRGDADLLVSYLRTDSLGTNSSWKKWTEEHPELARVLWPKVTRLARRNEYILIPELFGLASDAQDPKALETALNRHLARRYARWADVRQAQGKPTAATELLRQALELVPADDEFKQELLQRQAAGNVP